MEDSFRAEPVSRPVCVFIPSPILTITIEKFGNGAEQHHIHAGGQGFWVARMIRRLDVDVCLVAPFGGDTGAMIRYLIEREDVETCGVEVRAENGSYVHDRRGGQRVVISDVESGPLSRHGLDDLYDTALVQALNSSVLVLTGPSTEGIVPDGIYTRLARDARKNGVTVVADMSGDSLIAALEGGLHLIKVSHEQLLNMGVIRDWTVEELVNGTEDLHKAGAANVVITRAGDPAVAFLEGELWEVTTPLLEPVDHRGAGDSMTAGISAALARGDTLLDAVRLGAGAGALNVTRHGLGTGNRDHVERISGHVRSGHCDPARILSDLPQANVGLLEWVALAPAVEAAARCVRVPVCAVAVPYRSIVVRVGFEQELGRGKDAPRWLAAKGTRVWIARLGHRAFDIVVRVTAFAFVLIARHVLAPSGSDRQLS